MTNNLYESDVAEWADQQASHLRAGNLDALDLSNLAEEIESVGTSQRRELRNRLRVLLMHLLKWQMQPDDRSNSWRNTIREQREQILSLLEDSPSLRRIVQHTVERQYPLACEKARFETGLDTYTFPSECPYSEQQVLDLSFPARQGDA